MYTSLSKCIKGLGTLERRRYEKNVGNVLGSVHVGMHDFM
jgi:hypothetical protein